jgi:hypothetical protein
MSTEHGGNMNGSLTFGIVVAPVALVSAVSMRAGDLPARQNPSDVSQPVCRATGKVVPLSDLAEASGVAASHRTPVVLWAHNDSGEPAIFALNEHGSVMRRVRVTGAKTEDWEDISVGPCPQGSCVYIGDIGDNSGRRDRITIYRAPEPSPDETSTQPVEAFHAAYPDGAHDAEALFVARGSAGEAGSKEGSALRERTDSRDADVFIITKGDPGSVSLYRFPRPLRPGTTAQLERVGEPAIAGRTDPKDRPTGAGVSPDGQWVAVRTSSRIAFYRTGDLVAGRWREASRVTLESLREPQGEGIAFAEGGAVFLVGEGGGLSRAGTFARLTCTLP